MIALVERYGPIGECLASLVILIRLTCGGVHSSTKT
jgi:hypothetical protein